MKKKESRRQQLDNTTNDLNEIIVYNNETTECHAPAPPTPSPSKSCCIISEGLIPPSPITQPGKVYNKTQRDNFDNNEVFKSFDKFLYDVSKKDNPVYPNGRASQFYIDLILSDRNRVTVQTSAGMEYKIGIDSSTKKEPWTDTAGKWYNDSQYNNRYSGPKFTKTTVDRLPVPYKDSKGMDRVMWGDEDYDLIEWCNQLREWQNDLPNIKREDGSTKYEKESERSKKTCDKSTIRNCWDSTKCIGYPNLKGDEPLELTLERTTFDKNWMVTKENFRYSSAALELLRNFRIDMYGNVICLPESVDGKSSNGALTFFDVDHIFPFSRGGRSNKDNFAAVQSAANRWVKSDNLAQSLSPRLMNCGMMATQLLAMVHWVEENLNKEMNTKRAMLSNIVNWLTKAPMNKDSFAKFQAPVSEGGVGYTVDAVVLLQYFGNRQQRELGKILEISTQTQAGSNQTDIRATQESVDPQPTKMKGKKCLNARTVYNVRSGERYIEVTGSTYPIKEDLRHSFGFDYYYIKSGSGYWLKYYDSDREMECVLADLASLAAREKMKYEYKGSINISHRRENCLQSPDHKESPKTTICENEQIIATTVVSLEGEEKHTTTESDEPVKSVKPAIKKKGKHKMAESDEQIKSVKPDTKKKGPIAKLFSILFNKKIK